jgi:phage tail sheath protein FI
LITSYSRNFIDSATNKIQDLTIQTYTYTGSDATKDLKLTGKNLSDIPGKTGSTLYGKIISVLGQYTAVLPPSPAIAGLYARVDQNKGVWKAPANEGLQSVIGPNVAISDAQQMNLNIDPNFGKSINAIRNFPGYGTVVWGARTLNGNDNEWRYINVRRFFTMVEESVKKSSHWAVFEPNTITTWVKIQAMVENYLFLKWRDGALAGVKPEQAFYVKVGLGSTMNAQDILEGRMNVEIGMAVARPAEFIVLKFSQLLQQS